MAERSIQPIGERILVEIAEAETKTASGLYIPESATEKPLHGKVLAIGGAVKDSELKVDDMVMYTKFSGKEVEFEGKKLLILDIADVLARF